MRETFAPCLAVRSGDNVLLIRDTPSGVEYALGVAALPRPVLLDFIDQCDVLGLSGNYRPDGTLGNVVVMPMTWTNLPPDLPDLSTVAMGSLAERFATDGSIPEFTPSGEGV